MPNQLERVATRDSNRGAIGGNGGDDLLADLAEGAEDGVEVVVGESEVEIADINGGFGRNKTAAASAGLGGGRRRHMGANRVVIVVDVAEARGLGRGHGHGEARKVATTQRQSVARKEEELRPLFEPGRNLEAYSQ